MDMAAARRERRIFALRVAVKTYRDALSLLMMSYAAARLPLRLHYHVIHLAFISYAINTPIGALIRHADMALERARATRDAGSIRLRARHRDAVHTI